MLTGNQMDDGEIKQSIAAQIERSITLPSLEAIADPAKALREGLAEVNEEEYPVQARRMRDVFICLADYILEELWNLRDPADPIRARTPLENIRARALASITHILYSYIRYLWASSPRQSPPAVQVALSQLTDHYFPRENGSPVSVVRPQWKYNLTYVPVTLYLRKYIAPGVLDPGGKFGSGGLDGILKALWTRRPTGSLKGEEFPEFPRQLAVLSFAGLDTQNTLLYPLLAHELGHFIDYSYQPPLNLRDPLKSSSEIRLAQVVRFLTDRHLRSDEGAAEVKWGTLVDRVATCLRELLADLLATRMMGFAFFVAQAEFLKNVAVWPEATITPAGYPGVRFRLWVILNHLLDDQHPGNVEKFLKASDDSRASWLRTFLEKWKARLSLGAPPVGGSQEPFSSLEAMAESAIYKSIEPLNTVAHTVIPDAKCAVLTSRFFERITRLEQYLPPSCPYEEADSFAEIMSASWAYELMTGRGRRAKKGDATKQVDEYNVSCRLMLKAIELIPPASSATVETPGNDVGAPKLTDRPGVLSGPAIRSRLARLLDDPSRLTVLPLDRKAVQGASIDVRLGNWFAVARRTKLPKVRLGSEDEELLRRIGREEVFVPSPGTFLIHPGDFVLGATLEFLALPADLMAFVEGRSSLGRKGLIVATATQIAPGFHGVVVLELANTGTVPLELEPGMGIAQLVLQMMSCPVPEDELYHGKHYCQIKP
jgi:dCTP deaminase